MCCFSYWRLFNCWNIVCWCIRTHFALFGWTKVCKEIFVSLPCLLCCKANSAYILSIKFGSHSSEAFVLCYFRPLGGCFMLWRYPPVCIRATVDHSTEIGFAGLICIANGSQYLERGILTLLAVSACVSELLILCSLYYFKPKLLSTRETDNASTTILSTSQISYGEMLVSYILSLACILFYVSMPLFPVSLQNGCDLNTDLCRFNTYKWKLPLSACSSFRTLQRSHGDPRYASLRVSSFWNLSARTAFCW